MLLDYLLAITVPAIPPPEADIREPMVQSWYANRNEERFLRPAPLPSPLPPDPEKPATEPTPTQPSTETDEEKITVNKIEVTNYTVLGEEINKLKQPLAEKLLKQNFLSKGELQNFADTITQLYLENGFLTSSASLVEESLSTGIVEIRVTEGTLEAIEIEEEGLPRLNPDYIRSRVELGAGKPLNVPQLEDQLRLLRANPLFKNIEASLKPGSQLAQSILEVRATEADPFIKSASIDNFSPPSIGADRLGLDLAYRNLTGLGDKISLSYRPRLETVDQTYRLEFIYQIPLNPMDRSR